MNLEAMRSIATVFQGKGTTITKMPCLSYLRKKKRLRLVIRGKLETI